MMNREEGVARHHTHPREADTCGRPCELLPDCDAHLRHSAQPHPPHLGPRDRVPGGRKQLPGPLRGPGARWGATRARTAVSCRPHARIAAAPASRAAAAAPTSCATRLFSRLSRSGDPPSSSSATRAGFPAVGSGSLAPRGALGRNRRRTVHPPLSAVVSPSGLHVLLPEPWRSPTSRTTRWRCDSPAATARPLHRAPRERG